MSEGPRQVRRRVRNDQQIVGHRIRRGRLARRGEKTLQRARELSPLAGPHPGHHNRHGDVDPWESWKAGAEDDFVPEQLVHRLDAIGHLFQQLSSLGIPPGPERRVLARLLLGERKRPADRQAGIRDRAVDDGACGKIREQGRVGPQLGGEIRQLAFDLHERREQLQVRLRVGTPGDGGRHRARQRRNGGGLLAGAEKHLLAWLVHRHRSLDHRHHRAPHAGGHREDGPLHRGDGIAGQHSQVAPALFGGLDDDVAALQVNRLAAPCGGHEQLRSLVDIHHRSVGEPQHRVGSRARANRLVFADGAACVEGADGKAVQAALGGNDRGARAAGSHHAVDGVAPEINDRQQQCGCRAQRSPLHPPGGGPHRHRDDRPLALHLGDPGTTGGAATEMVFQQYPAAVTQLVAQIRGEVRPELGTGGADGVRHRTPHARPRGLERAGVHVFLVSFLAVLVPVGLQTSLTSHRVLTHRERRLLHGVGEPRARGSEVGGN